MNLSIDSKAVGFSLANAKACAEASRLAYVSEPTIQSARNHILILVGDEADVVAFRGTANFRDALTDAECIRENHIHAGFKAAFDSTAIELLEALCNRPEGKPLFFAGHSLGGALAVLAGWFFSEHYPQAQVYTFGQPRVADSWFASECQKRFGDRHFRFVNEEDIVPRIPGYLMGYRHSGQEVFFPSLGGMRFGAPLWMKLLSDIYGTYLDWRVNHELAQLRDHAINRYISRLNSI